ncbi:MAG: hypothetical protein KDG89_15140, partial [Geminicoccaceae bacterium]|nr:hypothetical protein [Geminicoccaceae bacterium]
MSALAAPWLPPGPVPLPGPLGWAAALAVALLLHLLLLFLWPGDRDRPRPGGPSVEPLRLERASGLDPDRKETAPLPDDAGAVPTARTLPPIVRTDDALPPALVPRAAPLAPAPGATPSAAGREAGATA